MTWDDITITSYHTTWYDIISYPNLSQGKTSEDKHQIIWNRFISHEIKPHHITLYHIRSDGNMCRDITLHRIISLTSHQTTSHMIRSYHNIKSCYITRHDINWHQWHHINWHHITHHMTLNHIKWHHISSYHIKWHHITSNYILSHITSHYNISNDITSDHIMINQIK